MKGSVPVLFQNSHSIGRPRIKHVTFRCLFKVLGFVEIFREINLLRMFAKRSSFTCILEKTSLKAALLYSKCK